MEAIPQEHHRTIVVEKPSNEQESFDSENINPRKRKKPEDDQMWACPFYQRHFCVPNESVGFRKCVPNPGFDDVHRIKAHLYKYHSPVYCKRCYSIFKEENELEVHQRSYLACGIKPQELDGLTSSQIELLKPRDRSGRSEEERWKTIYRICFPDDKNIPSPYYGQYWEKAAVRESVRKEVLENIWRKTKSPKLVQCVNGAFNSRVLRTLSNTCDGTTRDQYQMAASDSQHPRQTPTSSYHPEPEKRIGSRELETDLGVGFLDCGSQCPDLHRTFDSANNSFSGFENDNPQFRGFSGTSKPIEDDGLFGDENDYSQFPDASSAYKPQGDVFSDYHNDNALPGHMPELYGQCDRDSGDTSVGVFGSDDSNQTLVDVYEFKDLDMEGTSLEE